MTSPKIDFLPDIYQYLEQADNAKSIDVDGLEELACRIRANTGLSEEACNAVLKLFFQEIRNAVLRGEKVVVAGFGKFFLSAPKTVKNKKRVFVKFQPYDTLLKKL